MRAAGHAYNLLSSAEENTIHKGVLRILAEVGMEIQNDELLRLLAEAGARVDLDAQRARFPVSLVERFLAEAEKQDWEARQPRVGGSAGVYHGKFHDPESNELLEWDERRLAYYFKLASSQKYLSGASMLGSRLCVSGELEPLYERYHCWKYGAQEGGSIYLDELCPYLYELYELRAAEQNKPIQEVFHASVYLIPALKLGRHEAWQVAWFRKHGLRVGIGDMLALGGTSPVTLAGTVTLNLAEQLALRILNWALFGEKKLSIGGSMSVIDMRTMIYPYGRPEMALANLMTAQMARYYGASFSGHAGLSDAKLPSVEAGYQKALTAIPTLLASGSFWMDAGLLSTDEVCSPVQMILDNEFLSALSHFCREFEVSEESLGLDTILEAGPGGSYMDKEHTARRFRHEHWQPALWSREMLAPWLAGPRKLDVDRAREQAIELMQKTEMEPGLPGTFENDLLNIIDHARQKLFV
jgi:trimethylamine--corrinoid protein Co-methyltransferase